MSLDKSKLWYLAGPMTNIPQFNFPQFEQVVKILRADGLTVISPHEQDTPEVQAEALASPDGKLSAEGKVGGLTWGQILAKDVELVADRIGGIIFLPDWHKSRGAKLEAFVGLLTGKVFGAYLPAGSYNPNLDRLREHEEIVNMSKATVQYYLREYMP